MPDPDKHLIKKNQKLFATISHLEKSDPLLYQVLLKVDRKLFLPTHLQPHAYEDCALPIGNNQTTSQPSLIGLMCHLAQVSSSNCNKVLEVGAGCGYQTAIVSQLCPQVLSIERIPELAHATRIRLLKLGYQTPAVLHTANLDNKQLIAHAPYDAIIVCAAASSSVLRLCQLLSETGLLIIPMDNQQNQKCTLTLYQKNGTTTTHGEVLFVPLLETAAN